MIKLIFVLIAALCLMSLLYGGIFMILEQEKNVCRLTHMFEYPQYVRINFEANKYFPKYGLYAYSEGVLTEATRAMRFTGAPVIFIPGNSGAYQQVRSLASVALRKGLDNNWSLHLDYFAIDLNGEYSGLFGGYLVAQQNFLKASIRTVLNLYRNQKNPPRQVILIGHSMGGKLAQSVLMDPRLASLVNTIITIASPIDKPLLNIDRSFNEFYGNLDEYLYKNRSYNSFDNAMNYCDGIAVRSVDEVYKPRILDDTLLVSIGGGNRDLLVHSGSTQSKYSDVNALTTSIPYVWLTTDHLCAVWCLQFVLVINRFLHSIIAPIKGKYNSKFGLQFIEDKSFRIEKAQQYFVRPPVNIRQREIELSGNFNTTEWIEDSKRVYTKTLDPGFKKTSIHMIRLLDLPQHKMLSVTALNIEVDDWVFGCAALEVERNFRYCSKATSLSHLTKKYPSIGDRKSMLVLDLHKIKRNNPQWTHVILKFPPSHRKITFHVDTFDSEFRYIKIVTPKWYLFTEQIGLDDTLVGSSFYKLEIQGLDESYQSIQFNIRPRGACASESHHAVARICVPWMKNCDSFQHFTNFENEPFYLNVPTTKPAGYNTTKNPISISLHLDPNCRYMITYKNSFGSTMARILQQFLHWMPAHMVAILILAFRYQITITPDREPFKCGKLHVALITAPSFFIVTTTRIFAKLTVKVLPPDEMNHSMFTAVIIHGAAFAMIMLTAILTWVGIYFYGNMIHKLLLRIIKLPIPPLPEIAMMSIIEKLPITAGVLLISIAMGSCGGVAIICGCVIYFLLLVKQYEDYLEEFVFHTAKIVAAKLFGRKSEEKDESKENKNEKTSDDDGDKNVSDVSTHRLDQGSKENPTNKMPILDESINKADGLYEDSAENRIEKIENLKENSTNNDNILKLVRNNDEEDQQLDNEKKKELSDKSEILLKTFENALDDSEFPDDVTDEQLDKMLADAIAKQAKTLNEKKEKEALERLEYDSVHESFSSINFHMTLFILLCLLAMLNLPATVSWANNYTHNRRLIPDPSFVPACICLVSVSILWQSSTPRNVRGYKVLSIILYMCGSFSVLYCQDTMYRLNYLISFVFALVTLMQIFIPKKPESKDSDEDEELNNKIKKIKTLLNESGTDELSPKETETNI